MGHVLEASCTCGYAESAMAVGSGFRHGSQRCLHPVLCAEGRHVVSVNVLEKPPQCPTHAGAVVKPYYCSPELQQKPGDHIVSQWGDVTLNSGDYLCPRCGQHALQFLPLDILWD